MDPPQQTTPPAIIRHIAPPPGHPLAASFPPSLRLTPRQVSTMSKRSLSTLHEAFEESSVVDEPQTPSTSLTHATPHSSFVDDNANETAFIEESGLGEVTVIKLNFDEQAKSMAPAAVSSHISTPLSSSLPTSPSMGTPKCLLSPFQEHTIYLDNDSVPAVLKSIPGREI